MPRRTIGPVPPSPVDESPSPYDMIRDAIISGELRPGQALVETAVASWCGVSRTPVREALRRLEQDGLIRRDARGMAVRERSQGEILDIFETRLLLESAASRLAAERRTQHDLRTLHQWVERGRAVTPGDGVDLVAITRGFHTALREATHNESLIDVLKRLTLHLARYPHTTLTSPGRWEKASEEHAALAEAIEARDGELAHSITLTHLTEARDIRLALFERDWQGH